MRTAAYSFALLLAILNCPAAADPRGPIPVPSMTPRVVADGVDAGGYRYSPQRLPQQAGSWIWLPSPNPAPAAYFRKTVSLARAPQSVQALISADTVYRLYVNGRLVSRGPADPGTDFSPRSRWSHQWLYDVRELAPFFQKGENVIAAEVFTKGQPNFSLGTPGLTLEVRIAIAGRPLTTIRTDSEWRTIPGVAWSFEQSHLRYDARQDPASDWRMPGFDDSKWPRAVQLQSIWGPLAASEIPPRMEVVYPAKTATSLTLRNGEQAAVDYDRVLSAYLSLKVKGPAGAVVTIQPNEVHKPGFHRMTSVVLREGVTYYEFPVMDSFSRVNLQVTNSTAPVEIEEVRASFVSYPVTYKGAFECSDGELNRIWKASRWATQICMQTHHLDSPHHQEPISDAGDYLIEALENYYAFGEPWLARQDLRKFGGILKNSGYLNFHTSYSLLWLQMLLDYYDYTGDRALVRELAPVAYGLLDRFTEWRGKNGLISEAPNYMFMDWVQIAGIACHHPPAVIGQGYMTAFYYRGLGDVARIAETLGDRDRADRSRKLQSEIAAAFQRELWNPDKERYRDGKPFQTSVAPSQWLPADKDIETFSPHVNSLAVLYDLAPKPAQAAIMDRMLAEGPLNTQPYFMHFVFAAMAHAGLFEKYGVREMHRWQLDPDAGTMTEMWNGGDHSHGWVGTPLIQMSSRILGVTPASPGFRTIAIRPLPSGLEWARGKVPTPLGDVEVSWKRARGKFSIDVRIPEGATGEVTLPGSDKIVRLRSGAHRLETAR